MVYIALCLILIILIMMVSSLYYFNYFFSSDFKRKDSKKKKDVLFIKRRIQSFDDNDEEEFFNNKAFNMSIKSEDNLILKGYLLRNKETHYYLIMFHDFLETHINLRQIALDYWRKGFNCLICEERGHGSSQGSFRGLGFVERLDTILWIKSILNKDKDAKIILYGRGMGASNVLYSLCEEENDKVLGAIVDGGYGVLSSQLKYMLKKNFIYYLIYPFLSLYVSFILNFRIKDANVKGYIEKVKTPILYIHGDKDKFASYENILDIIAITNNCSSYIFKNCDHYDAMIDHKDELYDAIDSFIKGVI